MADSKRRTSIRRGTSPRGVKPRRITAMAVPTSARGIPLWARALGQVGQTASGYNPLRGGPRSKVNRRTSRGKPGSFRLGVRLDPSRVRDLRNAAHPKLGRMAVVKRPEVKEPTREGSSSSTLGPRPAASPRPSGRARPLLAVPRSKPRRHPRVTAV